MNVSTHRIVLMRLTALLLRIYWNLYHSSVVIFLAQVKNGKTVPAHRLHFLFVMVTFQVNILQKHLFLLQLSNPQYDNRLFILYKNCKLRIPAEYVMYINCCFCFVLTFRTILVHNMFCRCCELLKKIYQ